MMDLQPAGQKQAFDYEAAGIAVHIANRAKDAAAKIRRLDEEARASLVEIGKELVWAKDAFEHGTFIDWIDRELDMSWSSANRYMNVAKNIDPKLLTVSNLTPTILYKLAAPATPPAYRQALVERVEKGASLDEREIKSDLQDQKRARKEAEIEARKSPEARKRLKRERERQEKEWQAERERSRAEEQDRWKAAEQAIDLARAKLGADFLIFADLVRRAGDSKLSEIVSGGRAKQLEAIARLKTGQAADAA